MKHKKISAEERQRRKTKYTNMLVTLAILIVISLTSQFFGGKDVAFDWTETQVRATDPGGNTFTVVYADITSLELMEHPHYGTCLEGGKSASIHYGLWENEVWGTYRLCATDETTLCIVMKTDAETFVLSYESDSVTSALYDSLLDFISP